MCWLLDRAVLCQNIEWNSIFKCPGERLFDLRIYNQNGQLVESEQDIQTQIVPLKRGQLKSGVYIIQILFPDTPGKILKGTFIVY